MLKDRGLMTQKSWDRGDKIVAMLAVVVIGAVVLFAFLSGQSADPVTYQEARAACSQLANPWDVSACEWNVNVDFFGLDATNQQWKDAGGR